mmetsp:Transcript_18269/g.62983  ORF Transcript_18269/g.62983 Transcript_18269/m.62983 type:complete len:97 (+) Transcript_18269:174-464(+)
MRARARAPGTRPVAVAVRGARRGDPRVRRARAAAAPAATSRAFDCRASQRFVVALRAAGGAGGAAPAMAAAASHGALAMAAAPAGGSACAANALAR